MKTPLLASLLLFGISSTSVRAKLQWFTDFEEGKKAAEESQKPLLVNFTGSDWCHWCIQLKEEVFAQEAFAAADETFVLVELDFPKAEGLVTPEQRGKNEVLAQQLGVRGFPSVILFEPQGRPIARTGYQEGGAENYLAHLASLSEPFRNFQQAEGEERKEPLVAFLQTLSGQDIITSYQAELAELEQLDPEDESGLRGSLRFEEALTDFEGKVEQHLSNEDFEAIFSLVDRFTDEHNLEKEEKQHVYMARVMVYVEQRKQEEAFAEIDEMVKIAPESEFSLNVDKVKESITAHLANIAKSEAAEEPEAPSETSEAEGEKAAAE